MAFSFAYSLDGSGVSSIQDFALQTTTLYKASAGTNDYKRGDLVALDATGKLVRANAASTKAIGILEGQEFLGLVAQGQPYAAARSSFNDSAQDTTKYPNGVGKVRVESDSVYRVPISGTAASVIVGAAYNIILDAAGDQKLNQALQTVPLVKVVDVDVANAIAYVTMNSNNTF
jgi:hypothetical protein